MKSAVLVPIVAFALGACGDKEWSFDADAGPGGDAPNGGCSSDFDCMLASLHCDGASGQCVACVTDSQCTQRGLRRCDPTLERCVQCGNDADCGDPGMACQPTTHQCVPSCTSSNTCPQSAPLCSPRGLCVGCLDNQDCLGRGPTQSQEECDPMIGECAECTSNLQCPSVCDRTTDRCVGCLTSFDCTQDAVCDPDVHMCVAQTDASAFNSFDGR